MGTRRRVASDSPFAVVTFNVATPVQYKIPAMLKITLHDSASELRFRLEGKLSGPWVGEFRQCCETASSTTEGRRTVIDLRDVEFVDEAGQELLGGLSRRGVQLQASTPFMQSIIEAAAASDGCATVKDKPRSSSDAVLRADSSRSHSRAL